MFLKLRILFTILSAIAIALVFPLGFIFNWTCAIISALFAAFFFVLMLLAKQAQEKQTPSSIVETKIDENTTDNKENKK